MSPSLPGDNEQKLLFEVKPGAGIPERLRVMLLYYGKAEGKRCGDCKQFKRVYRNKTFSKCTVGLTDHGIGTDWRARWQACGKFEGINDE